MSLETLIYRHDTHLFKPNTLGKDLLVSVTFYRILSNDVLQWVSGIYGGEIVFNIRGYKADLLLPNSLGKICL